MTFGHLLTLGVFTLTLSVWLMFMPYLFTVVQNTEDNKKSWAYPFITSLTVVVATLTMALTWGIYYSDVLVTVPYVGFGVSFFLLCITAAMKGMKLYFYKYFPMAMIGALATQAFSMHALTYDTVLRDRSYTQSGYTASANQLTAFGNMYMQLFWLNIFTVAIFTMAIANVGNLDKVFTVVGFVFLMTIGCWEIITATMLYRDNGTNYDGRDATAYVILLFFGLFATTVFAPSLPCPGLGGRSYKKILVFSDVKSLIEGTGNVMVDSAPAPRNSLKRQPSGRLGSSGSSVPMFKNGPGGNDDDEV